MKMNDTHTPLHLLKPEYKINYGKPSKEKIIIQMKLILNYLEKCTGGSLIDKKTGTTIRDKKRINEDTIFADGDFRLTSYEWGVTYAGMLHVGEIMSDKSFIEYAAKRLKLISDFALFYINKKAKVEKKSPIYSVVHPDALDDAGALCFSMIKASEVGSKEDMQPVINNFIDYIFRKESRLPDGTFARNRPYPNTLWLDDLYMSVPALAKISLITGKKKYIDDAIRQVEQFSKRMFNKEKKLYMHGWVQGMDVHPEFYWGRANGWAIMAMVELLSVLSKDHYGYSSVLEQFRKHVYGIVNCQSGTGFWHQLLNKEDSYLETSATAIFTYSLAKAINQDLIDKYAYAPTAVLGWNAISSKINRNGQIEGTCVGSGLGFDPAFYYHRPVSVFAAHSYGPVLLAGGEIIKMLENHNFDMVENSFQLKS
jgi:unsaturated rhamnogalacturonyl hydrolase